MQNLRTRKLIFSTGLAVVGIGLVLIVGLTRGSAETRTVPFSIRNQASLVATIQQKTQVPTYFPTQIPVKYAQDLTQSSETKTAYLSNIQGYAGNAAVNEAGYELSIDYTPDCEGATACSIGFISGSAIDSSIISLPSILDDPDQAANTDICRQYAPSDFPQRPPLKLVTLAKGIKAVIVPYSCGASFGNTQVIWDHQAYRYTIGLKHAGLDDMVAVANSAIRQGTN